jgi:hypothetical protein
LNFAFLFGGAALARLVSGRKNGIDLSWVSGAVLICLAISKFFV